MHQIFFTHKRQPRIVCLLQKRIHYNPLNQYVASILLVWAGWQWKSVTYCENGVFEIVEIMSSFFKSRVKTSPLKPSKIALHNKAMNILFRSLCLILEDFCVQGAFFNYSAQISVLKRKTIFNQRESLYIEYFMEQNILLGAHRFSFWYWKLGGTVEKNPLYVHVCKRSRYDSINFSRQFFDEQS